MTEPTRGPGRPRIEAADTQILEAALTLMARHGYTRMTLDEVAAEAGVTKPAIYRRYPNKQALAVAALAHYRVQGLPAPTGHTRADLAAQLAHFKQGIERPFGMVMIGTVLAEEIDTPDLLAQFREHIVTPRREAFRRILQTAQQRGELRSDADIELAVTMLVGTYYAQYLAGQPFAPDWVERVVKAVWQAVAASIS
jgi:AcrR family transcriptional regulator